MCMKSRFSINKQNLLCYILCSKYVVTIGFPCRNESCKKQISTKFNRIKHEQTKAHYQEAVRSTREIPYNGVTKFYPCPTADYTATSKYKHNIINHLKSCYTVNKNKNSAKENKICSICNKSN